MRITKLKSGHFVQIEFSPYSIGYFEFLEFNESDFVVKVKNIETGIVSHYPANYIWDILTKPFHLKKIGFEEVQTKMGNSYNSIIETKYLLNDIEIIDFGYFTRPKTSGTDRAIYSRYSPFVKPYDLTEIRKGLLEGTMSEADLDGHYPSLYYLNSLFDYLDKRGIQYDKKEVVLSGR
ncbi:MAG: hypothetical protein KF870_07345 [Leadbetterella sp.]|nr:hypothetical protein [Leadbetterella sp.]